MTSKMSSAFRLQFVVLSFFFMLLFLEQFFFFNKKMNNILKCLSFSAMIKVVVNELTTCYCTVSGVPCANDKMCP